MELQLWSLLLPLSALSSSSSSPLSGASLLIAATCICFVGILCCCLLHSRHLLCKHKLPPGSLGLPLLGETLQFALLRSPIGTPLPFFSSRMQRFGSVFKTHVLGRPTVVSMDPELTKFLLSNDGKLVQGYFPVVFRRILGPVLTLQGDSHRALRELTNLIASSSAVQKLHVETVQEHFLTCLESWRNQADVLDAQRDCKEWVFSYSIKISLGLAADDPTAELLMRDFFTLSSGYSSVPINLPGTRFNKVLKARQRILATITKLARLRKHQGDEEPKDILDVVLKRCDESRERYCGLDVTDWIFFFVVGAFENTFLLLVNVLRFLSENAHVVNQLKRENVALQRTKKYKEKLTWDDYLQKMHFTRSVVRETLRLTNIAPYLMKESTEDILFKGMVIPRGWMVILNFSMVHLSPCYYPNPLQFDPWRWMNPQNDKESNNPDFLIPFGGGLRRCPGYPLAMFEVSIFIHYLVTLYKWERVFGKDAQRDEVTCLSFPLMRNGLPLKLQPLD
ncbi:hypothetical protein GOP47_0021912 [Adiantum capillus-veneris]|uniref:Cytochrome P450 n=1 Tax=Adiantum capillus-veneris TaxID=13818 RepID=A0A9D4U8L4_ADICA|nr:hypothetical protein GOP47_0021912 [Adiantum capillus-veneris]